MSKLGLVVVLFFMTGRTFAHQYPAKEIPQPNPDSAVHFVLIQADPGRAFYIRIGEQVYGSSEGGHLILAPLRDSTYTIVVGFPAQIYPEQRFVLIVRKKDFALSLRRMAGRWALYDKKGQTLALAPDPLAGRQELPAGVKKDDAFSRMMSAIVRDTAVMYNTYVVSEGDSAMVSSREGQTRHRDSTKGAPVTGDRSTAAADGRATGDKRGRGDSAVPSAPTGVMKLLERKSPQALRLVFTDRSDSLSTDTIDVVIPVDSASGPAKKAAGSHSRKPRRQGSTAMADSSATRGQVSAAAADSAVAGSRGVAAIADSAAPWSRSAVAIADSAVPGGRSAAATPDTTAAAGAHTYNRRDTDSARAAGALVSPARDSSGSSAKPSLVIVNSDCHAFATDYDVDKLRVKMMGAANDADRVAAAHKVFKTKCFSTKQLRALSEVFATEAGKFQFLQSAYPFDSDDQFANLADLFTDPVYTGKFRTMTGGH